LVSNADGRSFQNAIGVGIDTGEIVLGITRLRMSGSISRPGEPLAQANELKLLQKSARGPDHRLITAKHVIGTLCPPPIKEAWSLTSPSDETLSGVHEFSQGNPPASPPAPSGQAPLLSPLSAGPAGFLPRWLTVFCRLCLFSHRVGFRDGLIGYGMKPSAPPLLKEDQTYLQRHFPGAPAESASG
jgi:hypothetical protein